MPSGVGRDVEFSGVRQMCFKPNSQMVREQRQLSLHPIGEFRQNLGVRPGSWLTEIRYLKRPWRRSIMRESRPSTNSSASSCQ